MRRLIDGRVIAMAIAFSSMLITCAHGQQRSDTHRYGEYTLADWKARLVDFDSQSPSAASQVAPLLDILTDEQVDDVTRRNAALALGSMGLAARDATPVLVQMIENSRRAAAPSLWAAKSISLLGPAAREATPALVKIISDDDQPLALRQLCCEALGRIAGAHPDAVSALIRVIQANPEDASSLRPLAVEAIGVAGPDAAIAVPILIRILRNPGEAEIVRRQSVIALGKIGPPAAIAASPLAEALLLDESEAVRDSAAQSLATIGPRGIAVLRQLLNSDDAEVRWRVAMTLGKLKTADAAVIAALREKLADRDEQVRRHAATALAKLNADPQMLSQTIVRFIQSEQRETRMAALDLITSRDDIAAALLPDLQRLTRDQRPEVRRLAKLALQRIRDE